MGSILAVENQKRWREVLSRGFEPDHPLEFLSPEGDPEHRLSSRHHDLVILDLQAAPGDPFRFLSRIRTLRPHMPVVVTSETEETEIVVRAIKEGAFDFVGKPYSAAKIRLAVDRALDTKSLRGEIDYLRHEQDVIYDFDRIIAESPNMKAVIGSLKKFAETDATILMTGETGTGKSFLSGSIHFNGHRRHKPFVKINCSNIPETLLESELFGHEKGAFTGADRVRVGRFEQAQGGTIFLDEIGELSMPLQGKLLRVLEEKAFERVGGNRTIHSDVRVIAATNRVLEEQIAGGKFREDLFYRINVLTVHLPPLRERRQCIEPLAHWLLERVCRTLRKRITGFAPEVLERFRAYSWPGNIRQMANTIERAAILEEGEVIGPDSISLSGTESSGGGERPVPAGADRLRSQEKALILKALEDARWVQKDAALALGVTPRALNYKIRKFGITHPGWKRNR